MFKTCSKCGQQVEIKDLIFIGTQRSGDAAIFDLDLYNHACGTTLTNKVYHTPKNAAEMALIQADICDDILKRRGI